MSRPVPFVGCNNVLAAPKGSEGSVTAAPVFGNGRVVVSCWQFSDEEMERVRANGNRVFLALLSGKSMPPAYVGDEEGVRGLVADTGPVWKRKVES